MDDLGADSLDIFQIIMGIEEAFDVEIPNEAAEKIVTVGDAVEADQKSNFPELNNEKKPLLGCAANWMPRSLLRGI